MTFWVITTLLFTDTDTFIGFYKTNQNYDLNIMMVVKDKNISALKCIHATRNVAEKKSELFTMFLRVFVVS
jgi:hypothetical protein